MNKEKHVPAVVCGVALLLAPVLFLGIAGLLHGLYFNGRLSDAVWDVCCPTVLEPADWLAKHSMMADPFDDYKYWCYLALHCVRPE